MSVYITFDLTYISVFSIFVSTVARINSKLGQTGKSVYSAFFAELKYGAACHKSVSMKISTIFSLLEQSEGAGQKIAMM